MKLLGPRYTRGPLCWVTMQSLVFGNTKVVCVLNCLCGNEKPTNCLHLEFGSMLLLTFGNYYAHSWVTNFAQHYRFLPFPSLMNSRWYIVGVACRSTTLCSVIVGWNCSGSCRCWNGYWCCNNDRDRFFVLMKNTYTAEKPLLSLLLLSLSLSLLLSLSLASSFLSSLSHYRY